MSEYADKPLRLDKVERHTGVPPFPTPPPLPLRLDKVEWHTGIPPFPTPPLFTDAEKEALGRAVDNYIEKQKKEDK